MRDGVSDLELSSSSVLSEIDRYTSCHISAYRFDINLSSGKIAMGQGISRLQLLVENFHSTQNEKHETKCLRVWHINVH